MPAAALLATALLIPFSALLIRADRRAASEAAAQSAATETRPQLPGGGRVIFPGHRVIAYYGSPVSDELGILGSGSPSVVARSLIEQAKAYTGERRLPVLPAFELISTIASRDAGADGMYRFRLEPAQIRMYLEAARAAGALLVIDVQPGRSNLLAEVQVYEQFLREPDVGLALDPEWHVGPLGVPGHGVGSVDASQVNQVARWLAGIVRRYDLPQKLLIVHQFKDDMITNRDKIVTPPELAVTIDLDGIGHKVFKVFRYQQMTEQLDKFHVGVQLYFKTDEGLLQPRDIFRLNPPPDVVIYQ